MLVLLSPQSNTTLTLKSHKLGVLLFGSCVCKLGQIRLTNLNNMVEGNPSKLSSKITLTGIYIPFELK
jgi:hypothetical protein